MNADHFKKELEKYSVVRSSNYVKVRSGSRPKEYKSEPVKSQPSQVIKTLEQEKDFWDLVNIASKKIITNKQQHAKFMQALANEHSGVSRLVNLEILEEFSTKELA